jgi:serine/threonine-protein kinase SRPK3
MPPHEEKEHQSDDEKESGSEASNDSDHEENATDSEDESDKSGDEKSGSENGSENGSDDESGSDSDSDSDETASNASDPSLDHEHWGIDDSEHPSVYVADRSDGNGTFRPVRIGEELGGYKVVMKLGFGENATVWLGKSTDDESYAAIKVKKSDAKEPGQEAENLTSLSESTDNVVSLLDSSTTDGPNGEHEILILEPLIGCLDDAHIYYKMGSGHQSDSDSEGSWTQYAGQIVYQILKALEAIHDQGIIHGDLVASNVMFGLPKDLTDDTIGDVPKPDKKDHKNDSLSQKFLWIKRGDHKDELPPYIAMDRPLMHQDNNLYFDALQGQPRAVVGGFSYAGTDDDHDLCYTSHEATKYTPPEKALNMSLSSESDIWAFGCLVYLLMAKSHFIDADKEEEILPSIVGAIGAIPHDLVENWQDSSDYVDSDGDLLDHRHEDFALTNIDCPEDMEEEEKKSYLDFMGCILKWKPKERWSAKRLLQHEWIRTYVQDDGSDSEASDSESDVGSDDEDSGDKSKKSS